MQLGETNERSRNATVSIELGEKLFVDRVFFGIKSQWRAS
jgi:hypothetical protein